MHLQFGGILTPLPVIQFAELTDMALKPSMHSLYALCLRLREIFISTTRPSSE